MKIAEEYEASGHRVVIRPESVETVSEGGIVIELESSDTYKRKQHASQVGTVLAVGEGAYLDPSFYGIRWCEVGDTVRYAKHSGSLIYDEDLDETLHLVNDEDIHMRKVK